MTKADFESQAGDSIHIEVEIDFHALVVGENAFILVVLELLSVFGVLLRFVNAAELTYILAFLVFGFEDEETGWNSFEITDVSGDVMQVIYLYHFGDGSTGVLEEEYHRR